MDIVEAAVLGLVQGFTEWLPLSSEGALVLIQTNLFGGERGLKEMVELALFLHIGTFFAALLYFRKEVLHIFQAKNVLIFLTVATAASGVVGFFALSLLETGGKMPGKAVTLFIGSLLIVTALLQLKKKTKGYKDSSKATPADGALLGIVQGFAALPGLSRSGLTVSALLLRGFDDVHALRLSFLMSLPAVLGANIVLNIQDFTFSKEMSVGLLSSFLAGILTIHFLLKLARKVNFGYFVFIFGAVMIVSSMFL